MTPEEIDKLIAVMQDANFTVFLVLDAHWHLVSSISGTTLRLVTGASFQVDKLGLSMFRKARVFPI